jgi:hypothetical protein
MGFEFTEHQRMIANSAVNSGRLFAMLDFSE